MSQQNQPSHASPAPLLSHVAIIMDGNGRWAEERGLPRVAGHRAGVAALRKTVSAVLELGIPYLTIYGFSLENWSRPASEISDLMFLLRLFIRNDLATLEAQGVRVKMIGFREGVDPDILTLIDEAEKRTENNNKLSLCVAFNYGGRQEIVEAVRKISVAVCERRILSEKINEEVFSSYLQTAGVPDPELMIRTSGEMRLSNFLLWQCAYAEFVFLPIFWPDFDSRALNEAIETFMKRQRRFGGI